MARIAWLVLACFAGVAAFVLIASGITIHHDGEVVECASVINAAAVDSPALESAAAESACQDALVQRTELAGLLVLACVSAGTVATFQGRPLAPTPAAA
jgi:hypothetical protein